MSYLAKTCKKEINKIVFAENLKTVARVFILCFFFSRLLPRFFLHFKYQNVFCDAHFVKHLLVFISSYPAALSFEYNWSCRAVYLSKCHSISH